FAASLVSTGFQVAGQIGAANAEAEALRREAENREIQAKETLRRARINAEAARREGERLMGAQTAGYAASGVDIGTGSPLLTMQNTAFIISEDVNRINDEARREAEMIRRGAASLWSQAGDVRRAGALGAVGTSLTAAIRVGDRAGWF